MKGLECQVEGLNFFFLFLRLIDLFTLFLAASGLSCSAWDLRCGARASL